MKNILLYLLLLLVVPATAQSGLFDKKKDQGSQAPAKQQSRGPLINAGDFSKPNSASHNAEKGMNSRDYDEVVRVISKEVFDEKRLNVAKRIISVNPMNTRQIVNICKLFNYENNRLEFAKYAFQHCVDPNKFFLVDEVFLFDSSKDELHDFTDTEKP